MQNARGSNREERRKINAKKHVRKKRRIQYEEEKGALGRQDEMRKRQGRKKGRR
jgi:hypothetical protein